MTLTLIPMMGAIICLLLAMNWIRSDSASRFQTLLEQMSQDRRAYDALVRTLLGVPQDSQPQTETTLTRPETQKSLEPEEAFDLLSPEIQADLLREYDEHLARNGTLSGKPPRTNPMVHQWTPGAEIRLSKNA